MANAPIARSILLKQSMSLTADTALVIPPASGVTPPPVFTVPPSIVGTPRVGNTLASLIFTDGTVTNGSVTSRAYLLAGTAVALSYTLLTADAGKALVFQNTAVGVSGTVNASSAASTVQAASTLPTVSISAAQSKSEGASGAVIFTYVVSRSATVGAVAVAWGHLPGTTSADDYTGNTYPPGGFVNMADGVGTGTFAVSVNGDTTVEPNETFTVTISAPSGYALGSPASATGTILNDDVAFTSNVSGAAMAQSEVEYIFNPTSQYNGIPKPVPGNNNLIVYTQANAGDAPVRTPVNPSTVAAGNVNPAMAAISALLAYVKPTVQFALGDCAVPGTARFGLMNDTTDSTDGRNWSDFISVINMMESEFGPTKNLIECWYNADAAFITTFKSSFWPFYFGANADGSPYTLGTTYNTDKRADHCLYDASVSPELKGRGIFARSATKWHVLTPMPFWSTSSTVEATNFSEINGRLSEPARAVMIDLPNDALAASTGLIVGPSAHITRFKDPVIHPDTVTPDGQILFAWPFAIALLRAAGMTIGEPELVGIEGPSDGTYADLVFTLPNGGTLSTLAAGRGTTYTGTAPHQQPVTGIEITRSGGTRRPVFRPDQTSYPATHRGTVTISDTGSGSGAARRGRIRVTPSQPFAAGDVLSLLRGQATASLIVPRDSDLYPWFPIERIPALYDATATYPFEGIAVKPFQQDIAAPVAGAAFGARAAHFDGASYYANNTISVPSGSAGTLSLWFKNGQTTWNSTALRLFQFRAGSTTVFELLTSTANRMTMRINNDTASDSAVVALPTFTAATTLNSPNLSNIVGNIVPGSVLDVAGFAVGTTVVSVDKTAGTAVLSNPCTANGSSALTFIQGFALNQYYHLAAAWVSGAGGTGKWVVYINDILVLTTLISTIDMNAANLTQIGIGAQSTGSGAWIGDIGHLYINLAEGMDLSVSANRAKFSANGLPVSLGDNGEKPTGNVPAYYYDGTAPAWSNRGSSGNVTLTGALTVGTVPSHPF